MASLLVTEAPGGIGDVYQCPFCSLLIPTKRRDTDGNLTEHDIEPPRNCQRCGSPMDMDGDGVQKFQDAKALEASSAPARAMRRTVKV